MAGFPKIQPLLIFFDKKERNSIWLPPNLFLAIDGVTPERFFGARPCFVGGGWPSTLIWD